MANPMEKVHTRRIVSLALLCVILFGFAAIRVFNYQIVDHEDYLAIVQRSSSTTVKITAARGEIVDRNGVPFTRNMATFNVEFDFAFLDKKQTNHIIYSLIKTFEALGEEWQEDLPITKTTPYEFLPDRESDITRMKGESRLNLNSYATAQNCMDAIYEMCDIKKYKDDKGKCTHCGENFDECIYEGYSEDYSRKIAGVRYQMISDEFSVNNPRFTFAEEVKPETVALIRELSSDFVGVDIAEKAIRTYISGDVASHLIGKIGPMDENDIKSYIGSDAEPVDDSIKAMGYAMNDLVGKSGVEKAFETELRGKNGEMTIVKNSLGEVIDVIETIPPVAGKTIKLTIDFAFQKELQQLFEEYILNYNDTNKEKQISEAGALVVLDTKTNGVLASLSYPYYDINDFYKNYSSVLNAEGQPEFNRALTGLYRPGSTFKPIVATGALEEGKITPDTTIYCGGAYTYWAPWIPTCLQDGHYHTSLDVSTALKWSCNIFFYDTGRILGIDKLEEYANLFGIGVDSGLEIANRIGKMSSPKRSEELGVRWEGGNVAQAAIGQLDTQVTPLQLAIQASTMANKGTRYEAHILKEITNYDQSEVLQPEQKKIASEFDMSDSTFEAVKNGMIQVGLRTTAPNQLNDLGYSVALKSGSPEYAKGKTHNDFIGFSPADNPEIAFACLVEKGKGTTAFARRVITAYEKSKITAQN